MKCVKIAIKIDISTMSWASDFIDNITNTFRELRDWCIIQLDVGSWEISDLLTERNIAADSIHFGHTFIFHNNEDAVAFTLQFGS